MYSIITNYPSESASTLLPAAGSNTCLDLKYKEGNNKNSYFDFSPPMYIKPPINIHLIYHILGLDTTTLLINNFHSRYLPIIP